MSKVPDSKKLTFLISTSRVRRCIDNLGMNFSQQTEIDNINAKLLALKKSGIPAPKRPSKVGMDSRLFDASLAAWETATENWKAVSFPVYVEYQNAYELYKKIKKLHDAYLQPTKTDKNAAKISFIVDLLRGVLVQYEDESPEDFAKRTSENLAVTSLLQGDVSTLAGVAAAQASLLTRFPDLSLWMEKGRLSHAKVRFNESAVVGIVSVCEEFVTECVKNCITSALAEKKTIIRPEHVLGSSGNLRSLYANLPSYKLLETRSQREQVHTKDSVESRKQLMVDARARAAKQNRPYSKKDKPDFSGFLSFEESEVLLGHAKLQTVQKNEKKARHTYIWPGLDLSEKETEVDFKFYIDKIFKDVKDSDPYAHELKISKSAKFFLGQLIHDYIGKLLPKVRMLLDYHKAKTIDGQCVLTVLKLSLSDDCPSTSQGDVEWKLNYSDLFLAVANNMEVYKNAKVFDDVEDHALVE